MRVFKTVSYVLVSIALNNCVNKDSGSQENQRVEGLSNQTVVIRGDSAQTLKSNFYVDEKNGVKQVRDQGQIFCNQDSSNPSKQICFGFPSFEFPSGAVGIVAPWFRVDGDAANELSKALKRISAEGNPNISGDLEISCKTDCQITLNSGPTNSTTQPTATPTPTPTVSGDSSVESNSNWKKVRIGASSIQTALGKNGIVNVRETMTISCSDNRGVMNSGLSELLRAYCSAKKSEALVESGNFLIPKTLFTLSKFESTELFDALPGASEDGEKSFTGKVSIECQGQGKNAECAFLFGE